MFRIVSLIQLIAHPLTVVDLCSTQFRRVGLRVLEHRHYVVITADDPKTHAVWGELSRFVPPHRLVPPQPSEEVVRKALRE